MEKRLILRGVLAGAVAGLISFLFARIFAEPDIGKAIAYESGRDAAQSALDRAAGVASEAAEADIFSRTIQADVGIGVGMILFGAVMGAFFAIAYAVCLGRVGRLRARNLAMLVALGGFIGFYLVPFLKYPANPPAIGHEETIRDRSNLYLLMLACSLVLLVLAVWLGRRLVDRFGNWNATLIAALAYAVAIGLVMALLPSFGELSVNVAEYGRHATETPLPLTDPAGRVVYPGFPADVLSSFRFHSVAAQVLLWGVLGLAFGPMAERLLSGETRTAAPAPVPAAGV